MNETPTPRTTSAEKRGQSALALEAMAMERELIEAKAKFAKLGRLVEFSRIANDAKSEQEAACSASFHEAIAYEMLEQANLEKVRIEVELEKVKSSLRQCRDALESAKEIVQIFSTLRGNDSHEEGSRMVLSRLLEAIAASSEALKSKFRCANCGAAVEPPPINIGGFITQFCSKCIKEGIMEIERKFPNVRP